ncbi:hypothetical protein BJ546DRAFT_185692 [Cryomyces antarcticus]
MSCISVTNDVRAVLECFLADSDSLSWFLSGVGRNYLWLSVDASCYGLPVRCHKRYPIMVSRAAPSPSSTSCLCICTSSVTNSIPHSHAKYEAQGCSLHAESLRVPARPCRRRGRQITGTGPPTTRRATVLVHELAKLAATTWWRLVAINLPGRYS